MLELEHMDIIESSHSKLASEVAFIMQYLCLQIVR